MDIPSSGDTHAATVGKPYKRRIWISILLTIFAPGLPLIYCGNLKRGILVSVAYVFSWTVYWLIIAATMNLPMMLIALILPIGLIISAIIFNIRYTKKTNQEAKSRIRFMWIWILAIFLAILGLDKINSLFIKSYFVEAYSIPTTSMENTLLVGDELLASKNIDVKALRCGNLIIYKNPNNEKTSWIKRIVAIGGDTIQISKKDLYVNHKLITLPPGGWHSDSLHIYPYSSQYLQRGYWGSNVPDSAGWGAGIRDNMPERIIPEGKFFVLGDNRDNSADSRFWGFVDESEVVGIARFIHFSVDRQHWKIRWNRIGKRLDDYIQ